MNWAEVLQATQLLVSIVALGGIAFSLGRVFGRIERLEVGQTEIKGMLSGGDDGGGIFLRRSEAELMMLNANQARAAFDKRLEDLSERLGGFEHHRRESD